MGVFRKGISSERNCCSRILTLLSPSHVHSHAIFRLSKKILSRKSVGRLYFEKISLVNPPMKVFERVSNNCTPKCWVDSSNMESLKKGDLVIPVTIIL